MPRDGRCGTFTVEIAAICTSNVSANRAFMCPKTFDVDLDVPAFEICNRVMLSVSKNILMKAADHRSTVY